MGPQIFEHVTASLFRENSVPLFMYIGTHRKISVFRFLSQIFVCRLCRFLKGPCPPCRGTCQPWLVRRTVFNLMPKLPPPIHTLNPTHNMSLLPDVSPAPSTSVPLGPGTLPAIGHTSGCPVPAGGGGQPEVFPADCGRLSHGID